jgi:glycosyltransferase involved in cell wall biosynthesis
MSGDDLHIHIFDPARTAAIQRVMNASRAIVLPSETEAEVARQTMPALASRVRVVPLGVRSGDASFQLRRELGIPMSAFVFLLPGAIRGAKNQGIAIAALDRVIEEHPNVHLVLAGRAEAGDAYGAAILEAVRLRPWCHHVEAVPHEAMGAAYSDADVVLNTSLAEAGSNVVLEAMAAGRALIVSAIPGNLGLVEVGTTALSYTDQDGLSAAARQLIRDASLRQRLGAAGHRAAESKHQPAAEIEALRALYSQIQPA